MNHYLLICLAAIISLFLFLSTSDASSSNKKSLLRLNRMKKKKMNSLVSRMNNDKISKDKFCYGPSDWLRLRTRSDYVVDKTSAIAVLESLGPYLQLCRPTRFGKSLLCSQLKLYYDVNTSSKTVSFINIYLYYFTYCYVYIHSLPKHLMARISAII